MQAGQEAQAQEASAPLSADPRTELARRLRGRRAEIEAATLLRIHTVTALPRGGGPEYAEGLRSAVATGLEFGLAAIEHGEEAAPALPEPLLAQARLAARSGVGLDTVLRRYLAGHTLLDDFLIEETERAERLDRAALKRLLRSQAAILDRLLAAVSAAYAEETERRPESAERRKAARIERLLGGELLDTAELDCDIEGWHLGAIAVGPRAGEALRELAGSLDRRLLAVEREEDKDEVWAWLGGQQPLDAERLALALSSQWPRRVTLALGEPDSGLAGWRLSHRQARAALSVAARVEEPIVRYADVALLASVMQDELAVASLHQLYLAPLEDGRDRGAVLRGTLRAYFASDRNVTSAAAALSSSRNTVAGRLAAVERKLGRPLSSCAADLEVALRLEELPADR